MGRKDKFGIHVTVAHRKKNGGEKIFIQKLLVNSTNDYKETTGNTWN